MANMLQTTEKAIRKRTNKALNAATKRYKRLMRQAAKAANARKREQYIAAGLGALVVAGVVAAEMKARMDKKKTLLSVKTGGRKKRRKK